MKVFELDGITCASCGAPQTPLKCEGNCSTCGKARFNVEIERSASGLDGENVFDALWGGRSIGGGDLEAFANLVTDDGEGAGIRFRTHSFLKCSGISGAEISMFQGAPVDERRRMYVSWKRREIEALRAEGHRICERCKVEFKIYDNDWNKAGLCSKSCYHAFMKSWGKGR